MPRAVCVSLAVFAMGFAHPSARAGSISFGATCESWGCPPGSYVSATFAGAQGYGPIDFVDSYNFPVNGGTIAFSSTDATSGGCTGSPSICTYGFGAGGNFQITGSIFGLPAGSVLIAGTFIAGGRGVGEAYGSSFSSEFDAIYINPTVLENLAFPSDFTVGQGSFAAYDSGGFPWSATISVTPSPTPESSAALLLALGWVIVIPCWRLLKRQSSSG